MSDTDAFTQTPREPSPSRRGLLLGAALVALHGLRQERILGARLRTPGSDFTGDRDVVACTEAIATLQDGGPLVTGDRGILDLMAHTQQVLRVSYEEWEAAIPVQELRPRGSPAP